MFLADELGVAQVQQARHRLHGGLPLGIPHADGVHCCDELGVGMRIVHSGHRALAALRQVPEGGGPRTWLRVRPRLRVRVRVRVRVKVWVGVRVRV